MAKKDDGPAFRSGWYVHQLQGTTGRSWYVMRDGRNVVGPYASTDEASVAMVEAQKREADREAEAARHRAEQPRAARRQGPRPERSLKMVESTDQVIGSAQRDKLPNGTKLYAMYKGTLHTATVRVDGEGHRTYVVGKESYRSPSSAGRSITGSATNGWRFWSLTKPEPKAKKAPVAKKATPAKKAPAKKKAAAKKAPAKKAAAASTD